MRLALSIMLLVVTAGLCSCSPQPETGVFLQEGVASDSLASNIVTRPVVHAFSALIGEGIEVKQAVKMVNQDGFMVLEISGYNRSIATRAFEYKVEWLDSAGMVIDTTTSKWLQTSAAGKSPFVIKAVAPRKNAVDFRMNTRKVPK